MKIHFWIYGEPVTVCGISMFPNTGDRVQYSRNAKDASCKNCKRTTRFKVFDI